MHTSGHSHSLEQLTHSSHSIIFIYHPEEKRFTYLNPAFEKIWQINTGDVLSDPARALSVIHPDDMEYLQEKYQKFTDGKEESKVEFRIICPDGSLHWISLSPHFITDEAGRRVIAGYAADITGQKDFVDTAFKFSSKKNSILETLSHDLMGPLNMVRNIASMLRKRTEAYKDTNIDHLIGMIETTCGKNASYIRDFLNQEYLESANVVMNKRRINLKEQVENIVHEYRSMPGNQTKDIQFFASGNEIFVNIDELKFIQTTNNLMSNAIKFTADDGKITVQIEEKADHVQITVSDNGIGIPKHLQPRVFEKFTPARRPGLRGEEPTGLGMAIVKQVVELHDGKIWFESEENKGSVFFITVPRHNADQVFL